ncbi:DUF2079 domain-containing protein [Thermococcus sp.]
MISGYILLLSAISINRYQTFRTNAFDLGIFVQSFWSTINGKGLLYNTVENMGVCVNTHLAVHASPILLFLVPIYRVLPYPETLLIVQTITIGFSAYPLYLLGKKVFKNERYSLAIVSLYLTNALLHGINGYDFHEASFAMPFIFLTAYYFETGDYKRALASGVLVLLAKEDAGIALLSLSSFYLLKDKKITVLNTYKYLLKKIYSREFSLFEKSAILLGLEGILWTILTMTILLLFFPGSRRLHEAYYHDFPCIQYIPMKILYFVVANLTLGFLTFLRPKYTFLLTTLPWIEILTSCQKNLFRIGFQYPYMLLPLSMISIVYSLAELDKTKVKQFLGIGLSVGIIMSLLTTPVLPIHNEVKSDLLVPPFYYQPVTHHDRVLMKVTQILGRTDLSILTQNDIFPQLANRPNTYVIWWSCCNQSIPKTDIILFDETLLYSAYNMLVKDYLVNYTKVYDYDGIEVWIRNDTLNTPQVRQVISQLEGIK